MARHALGPGQGCGSWFCTPDVSPSFGRHSHVGHTVAWLSWLVTWLWEMKCASKASGWKATGGCEPKRTCLSWYCMSRVSLRQLQVRRQRTNEEPNHRSGAQRLAPCPGTRQWENRVFTDLNAGLSDSRPTGSI